MARKRGRGRPKSRARSLAAKRAWARRRRAEGGSGTSHIGPVAHLARKVQGIDTRVEHLENKVGRIPKKYVKRHKIHKLGTLEDGRGHEYWAEGE
jgi:hypothetical protein